jgi:uncharacterized protein YneF (UPF0154 family)
MKIFNWRSRKYPVIRDEYGHSARKQAFDLFTSGHRPAQIYKKGMIPVKKLTLFRYFEDWKRLTHHVPYSSIRKLMRKNPEFNKDMIKTLADTFGMKTKEVVIRMQKPWGLMQAMQGQWPDYKLEKTQSEIENRFQAALKIISFVEKYEGKEPKQIHDLVKKLISNQALSKHLAELKVDIWRREIFDLPP